MTPVERRKRAAAERAVGEVENGMVVGLGTGTTAAFVLELLGERVRQGLRISGIPTSEATARRAAEIGIQLSGFDRSHRIDVTIDGADQVVLKTFDLIKGLGGALLREKIVAAASSRMIVVVDDTKIVDHLGSKTALPVEIARFGWQTVLGRLADTGCTPHLREAGVAPFETDGGNYIVDCAFDAIPDPRSLEARLSSIVGVVETGLFIGLATDIVVGREAGTEMVRK